jgi:hypothetical protein
MRSRHQTRRPIAVPAAAAALALGACGSGGSTHKATPVGAATATTSASATGTSAGSGSAGANSLVAQLGHAAASSAVTTQRLQALAAALHHPIYWAAGRVPGSVHVTRYADGSTLVTYVPKSGKHASLAQEVSVGTYLQADAAQAIARGRARTGSGVSPIPAGSIAGGVAEGVAVVEAGHSRSAYVAPTREPSLLVEVYGPGVGQAIGLLTSGSIQPIG